MTVEPEIFSAHAVRTRFYCSEGESLIRNQEVFFCSRVYILVVTE